MAREGSQLAKSSEGIQKQPNDSWDMNGEEEPDWVGVAREALGQTLKRNQEGANHRLGDCLPDPVLSSVPLLRRFGLISHFVTLLMCLEVLGTPFADNCATAMRHFFCDFICGTFFT